MTNLSLYSLGLFLLGDAAGVETTSSKAALKRSPSIPFNCCFPLGVGDPSRCLGGVLASGIGSGFVTGFDFDLDLVAIVWC